MISTESPEKIANRILVIEDDKAVSDPIHLLFTHYGFIVTVATTLAEGRKLMKTNPDLVVLDLGLPDGSGLELLEKIRLQGQQTRVYVLSANSKPEMDRSVRRLMPDRHFRKPFNFFEILEAVRKELSPALDAPVPRELF